MAKQSPIDPAEGAKLVLVGRVVTMNEQFRVIQRGAVYIDRGSIVHVKAADAETPAEFAGAARIDVGGTIYPGLIDLHNHLAYNALPLWNVPKKFTNRDQWGRGPDYRKLISGPMQVVGKTPELVPALIRYVECKNLLGGVTTSQGVELFSNAGVRRFYRGLVRNVEQTDEPELPEAATRVADVEAADRTGFLNRIKKRSCYLLHLSEGTDDAAREHFGALQFPDGDWAVADSLCGIHCAALRPADFDVMGDHKASMVWSPTSNLLLYGQTADVKAARDGGVRIGIGSDWSPSGTKNLLGELKVAKAANEQAGEPFSDRQLVAMATREAAAILRWSDRLGSIEPGRRADFLVIDGKQGDAYSALIAAHETDIRLVMINGVPRLGLNALMKKFVLPASKTELVRVNGKQRTLYLEQATSEPAVGALSLAEASATLTNAFSKLAQLAKRLEEGSPIASLGIPSARPRSAGEPVWSLALDELEPTGLELRPRIASRRGGAATGPRLGLPESAALASTPLSQLLEPIRVDPVTAVDDDAWLDNLAGQRNVPAGIKARLAELFA